MKSYLTGSLRGDAFVHCYWSRILFQISHVLMESVSSMHVWKLDQIYFLVCARNAACLEIPGEIHQENSLIVREEAQFRKNGVTVFQSQLTLAIQNNDI